MKKLILTGLSFLFAITLTFAQDITPENKAKEHVIVLTEKLVLSTEQQAPIYNIVLEKVKAKLAVQSDTTQTEEAVKHQLKTINDEANAKISELLTEEQKALFTKYLEEKKAKKEEGQEKPKE